MNGYVQWLYYLMLTIGTVIVIGMVLFGGMRLLFFNKGICDLRGGTWKLSNSSMPYCGG